MFTEHIFDRIILASLVALSFQLSAPTGHAQQSISDELSRAVSLYYAAEFPASLALLLDLYGRIGDDPDSRNERLKAELFLGLTHLGLNQNDQAKSAFMKICASNPNYIIDPREFPPKAIALFEDAKARCAENHCAEICSQSSRLITEGNLDAANARLESAGRPCSCASASAINEARFQRGKDLYAREQFSEAAKVFSEVLNHDGNHALAREFLRLSRHWVEFSALQAYLEWRQDIQNRRFAKAAASYQNIRSGTEPHSKQTADQIESEYRTVLSGLASSWKTACAAGDRVKMDELRREAVLVTSGLELGSSALIEMEQCTSKRCVPGDATVAVRRLRTRVNPQIGPSLRRYLNRVHVDVAIGEEGTVTVENISNANTHLAEEIKNAVEQWVFYPAVIDNRPRCVLTRLPIDLILP